MILILILNFVCFPWIIGQFFVQHLKKQGFGTKNLPDAIEWHCASFWNHALTKEQINKTKKTQDILNKAIAIPIWLKKGVKDYTILGKVLKNLK